MKMKYLLMAALVATLFVACEEDDTQPSEPSVKIDTVSISLGANYTNDIYYSLKNGVVSMPLRTEWDIAFYTNPRTSTIMINDGNKIVLRVCPNGNKDDWANVDTTGLSFVPKLYNTYSDTTWQNGAFDKNALGHPDYGWGVYSSSSHNVVGDSIHIIQLTDGTLKKLLIEKRDASNNTFYIKYANLDGTNEVSAEVPCSGVSDKNFVYFSMVTNQIVDHEPASATWDLVITKYWDASIPYSVVGFLSNNGILVAETDTISLNYTGVTYSKVVNEIGSDWKDTSLKLKENLAYFVKDREGKYYRIKFTSYSGMSSGNLSFEKTTY
jgi:hypothetical protein